ncbi:CLAVATA3/ESR (CLE)-related protein [Melia azedarach]|uniref:CLAVATA3/ESR (CLE)-related protein n=1 Tax=Melia azedarach TaxID=155640 RepID=A0ACC1WX79_MELAZ|nr:CLAVATA3/ESR (CLE)-related protein [Melia azedarach]
MASFRFSVCLIVIFLLFSWSETRPLISNPQKQQGRNLKSLIRALGKDAKEVINIGVENEKRNKDLYESKRASPGGPDPHHHSKNQ